MSAAEKPAAQVEEAAKAMKLKDQADPPQHPQAGQTADEGMTPNPNATIAPSGALDAEGQRPVLERSRKAR
ncbi:MAG: hypothetical protein Q7S93_17040 [Phenylobacterium sp.]|uniref:hypothetical protein n=1 Tax=Phenylobacterium sp. TaxID=1871053 RepID=UPI002728912B|nr:hypothetical protein [Phenylobacterium sp.]MDO8411761.1 hypothetical protein [Phenylobacterium sp.]